MLHVVCIDTFPIHMHEYSLALEMYRYRKLAAESLQYRPLFWKLPTLVGFTTSVAVAPFLVSDTPPVSNCPPLAANQAVPLLKVQVILPIPSGPDICFRSVMGYS